MKIMPYRRTLAVAAVLAASTMSACVAPMPGVYVPAGVRYVAPLEIAPAPGFYWDFNVDLGIWNWRHPQHGWYKHHR